MQRIEIMRYLLSHPTHPPIDEIFMELKKRIPTVSRTTIYNTLRMFSEKGGALMITIDEHHVCYDGTTTPHAHFSCKVCGRVFDMPDMQPPTPQSTAIEGFSIDDAQLYYKGVCADCQRKRKEEVS